jgi:signal peptidase I
MNLHGLVSGMINTVNPAISIIVRVSTGRVVSPDGTPVPQFASPITVLGQVQELSIKDLHQVEGLNLNGTLRNLYINGNINAGQRVTLKGGDVIVLPDGTVWLVVAVPESWPDWCRALLVLQNDSSSAMLLAALQAQTF